MRTECPDVFTAARILGRGPGSEPGQTNLTAAQRMQYIEEQIDWMSPVCYDFNESRSPSFSPRSRATCSPGQQDNNSWVSLRLRANALGRFFVSRLRYCR